MPRVHLVLPAAALLFTMVQAADAAAKAAYVDLPTALRDADVVALVEVESVRAEAFVGQFWEYRQRAIAHPIEVLKGDVPHTFEIAADRDFVCAPVAYAPGTYLVLLELDRGVLTTTNNDMGQAKVMADRIDWPYDEIADIYVPLEPVLADLRARLGPRIVELRAIPVPVVSVVEVPIEVPVEAPAEIAEASADETPPWLVPASMLGGALAVLLGFAAAIRRRR